ncbi:hypothetical protein D5272_16630 [bacterium D16-76]|nr:hypothetical protein [bacterium D16-76]
MTLQELNQYFRRLEQLGKARNLLASLEAAAAPQSPNLDGMPRASSGISDSVGRLAAEIADMRARVELLERQAAAQYGEIAQYIEGIPDDQARLIFRLRFLRGLSWKEVAAIVGGGNTEPGVKMICYRYLS